MTVIDQICELVAKQGPNESIAGGLRKAIPEQRPRTFPDNYFFKILVYPHHVLREHSMATGAGADRFSSGMAKAFGKPKGRAARVMKGQRIMALRLDKKNVDVGRLALKRANKKLPVHCKIEIK